jgi:SAM-dependent methyltransferase
VRTEYAQHYRELWQRHWWWRSRRAWVLDWIERLHRESPRRRILDVGCGDGLFFDQLSRFGEVDGLEPDGTLVSNPRWRDRIRTEPLTSEFRPEQPYDLLLMLDVLEHIEDDAEALVAAHKSLREEGHVLITVPALPALWSQHDEVNEHHRRYTERTLRDVLRHAGYQVETLRYFFFWTVAPLWARRALAPAGMPDGEYAVPIPCRPINAALESLSRLEHRIGEWIPWPVGSSLLAIARRA